jgi:hypothetical protein
MGQYEVMTCQAYSSSGCVLYNAYERGVMTVILKSGVDFTQIADAFGKYKHYVWRGEQRSDWRLESTFDRNRRRRGIRREYRSQALSRHLTQFKQAVCNMAGSDSCGSDQDWWAYGQHNNLETPLLDWTEDPYIAAFFAFAESDSDKQTDYRVVYALNREIEKWEWTTSNGRTPFVKFVPRPALGNNRASAQKGLFTQYVDGNRDITSRVQRNYSKAGEERIVLARVEVPNAERVPCLKYMNSRGINHFSLYPDLYGAAKLCNMRLDIEHFA